MAVTDGRRDSGLHLSSIKDITNTVGFRVAATVTAAVVVLAFIGMLFFMLREQDRKLSELENRRQELEQQLDELAREKERLEGKLEYTNSIEGLIQYARDNLGYVFPDDVRIDDGTNGD